MANQLVKVELDEKHMIMTMSLNKPGSDESMDITVPFLLALIKEYGVVTGIIQASLEALCNHMEYEKPLIVACGKACVDGEDGYYEYLIPMEDQKAKPVIEEDGSVDYLNSLEIAMVDEGEEVARYIPATKGEYGYNLYSEILKPLPGKDLPPLKGASLKASEDGKTYYAARSGHIYLDYDKVVIEPVYLVKGDLDIEHGNIRFMGDVEVRGDVRSQMEIHAEGNIYINGHVGNCKLHAGGDIVIGKGIQGKNGCEIVAGGKVTISFGERCNITATSVYADSLLDCRVFASDMVYVTSRHGQIIGGSINAMMGIEAKEIGNKAGAITKIQFGEQDSYRKRRNEFANELAKTKKDIDTFTQQIKKLTSLPRESLQENLIQSVRKMKDAIGVLGEKSATLENEVKKMDEVLATVRRLAYVKVEKGSYPGVILMNQQATLAQTESYKDVCYRCVLGQIQMMDTEDYEKLRKQILIDMNQDVK